MTFVTAIEIANTISPQTNIRDFLFSFIYTFLEINHNSPSIREMSAAIDIFKGRDVGKTSTSVVEHHLSKLEEQGKIKRILDANGKQSRSGRITVSEFKYTEEELKHFCGKCGVELQLVRPGKYQCNRCR